eukprot:448379_1
MTETNCEKVRMWLKMGCLLDEVNDNILIRCFPEIIQLYGGYKSLLLTLLQLSHLQQLNPMYDIIQQQFRKYLLSKKKENNYKTETIHLSLSNISNASISHICGYLTHKDIKSFKLVSKHIGIICLEEMQKISVKTLNCRNIFSNSECQNFFDLKNFNVFRYNRYNTNIRYYSLYEEWENTYNIP